MIGYNCAFNFDIIDVVFLRGFNYIEPITLAKLICHLCFRELIFVNFDIICNGNAVAHTTNNCQGHRKWIS